MEKTEESVGIRVYTTATAPQKPSPPLSESPKLVSISSLPTLPVGAAAGGGRGRKRRMVAQGVQKTVSKTSMLVNFLPTGTLLMFEMVLPSIYRDGDCNGIKTLMIHLLLLLCAMSCFFFHFTDSFKASDGNIYYGFVTPRGLAVFMKPPPPEFGGGDVIAEAEIPVSDDRYKLRVNDFVHAVMSVLVFMAIAFSDRRVTGCLFPGKEKEMDQVMESFPLMVGIVCSALFLVFPTTRYDTTSQTKQLSIVHFRPLCNFIMVPLLSVLFKSATNFVIFKTCQIRYCARCRVVHYTGGGKSIIPYVRSTCCAKLSHNYPDHPTRI
ncbi:hypothetical protein IGI04_015492 [Brassica rapa subsp. trilocularis]|uniref:Uncharacterized protein n=1 Tax=Brassica rapa subsp. trilocularis TaxID=1813537 RepID=A0ABQ7MSQ4_BRACM|nr:hypothetical protein IGI04_015492 [Brassica rapa subsp. trilocularis]